MLVTNLEDVIESNPNYFDAYLGLGIINYWEDVSVTGFQAFLTWIGGIPGDRETGWTYLEKTAKSGKFFIELKLIVKYFA